MLQDEFTSLLNAKPIELAELKAEAKPLKRVNVLTLLGKYASHLLVSAEYGTGKTYSLQPIAKQALYVAHRKSLAEPKAKEYAHSVCINSLHAVQELEGIKYIVLDEVLGVITDSLLWEAVPYQLTIDKLRNLAKSGCRFIALDRDADKSCAELLSKLIDQPFAYHEHIGGSREKQVVFANSLDGLYATAMQAETGVRTVLCNTAALAEELAQELEPSFLITGANSYEATKLIEEARSFAVEHGTCWLIGSPAVQEGVSIEGEEFSFIGYVQSSHPAMARPVSKGMQALHRVRNPKAIRCVCLLEQSDLELAESKSITDEMARLLKQEELISYIVAESYGIKLELNPYKELGASISRYRRVLTFEQRICLHDAWSKELAKSGYTIAYASDLELELPLPEPEVQLEPDAKLAPFCFTKQITDKNVQWLRANSSLSLSFNAEDPTSTRSRAYLAMHYGADFANSPEAVLAFKANRYSYYKKLKDLRLLLKPTEALKLYCYDRETHQVRYFTLQKMLADVLGKEAFSKLGSGEFEATIGRHDLQEHSLFKSFKELAGYEHCSNKRWFKQVLESFGITCDRCGKGYKKLKLACNIWLRVYI